MSNANLAPPLTTSGWLNAPKDFGLDALKGRVVLIGAFQMLCPGCVSHGMPQAQRVAALFDSKDVAVIGLHTVFEHFEVQGSRAALEAFAHEYRLRFPIGIDTRNKEGIPVTMNAYGMQGTPTVVLVDRFGFRRLQHFGKLEDLQLGAAIQSLLDQRSTEVFDSRTTDAGCTETGCSVE